MNRSVSFEYMNRQLVWNEFSEMLLLTLPLLNSPSFMNLFRSLSKDKSSGSTQDETSCPICQASPGVSFIALPCRHRYCYYCLRTRCSATPSFRCSRCGEIVAAMQRRSGSADDKMWYFGLNRTPPSPSKKGETILSWQNRHQEGGLLKPDAQEGKFFASDLQQSGGFTMSFFGNICSLILLAWSLCWMICLPKILLSSLEEAKLTHPLSNNEQGLLCGGRGGQTKVEVSIMSSPM